MSSYFDKFDREVSEMARTVTAGDEEFLHNLAQMEEKMVKDCELFAGDWETPDSVRASIMAVIALKGIRFDGTGSEHIRELAASCKRSLLSSDMHSLWHNIARMRYTFRYGLISDNPEWAVQRRDAWTNETKRDAWKASKHVTHPPMVVSDAPSYCKKAVEKMETELADEAKMMVEADVCHCGCTIEVDGLCANCHKPFSEPPEQDEHPIPGQP